ncbi:uncharacterized protein UTRI_10243 [Ustilago trichophora]|uniref:Uncharacterized protein n=1 Tax=Ustilago trichophora TaxID=86804 RepID=A0A5C3EMQ6_9BASI|nr:uncharacterized protein UTRI_10243 [Ustilago trichophora]
MATTFSKRPASTQANASAPPPSYDVAVGTTPSGSYASPRTLSPLNASDNKQFGAFSEKEQREREQELYNYGGRRGESSSHSHSRSFASSSSLPSAPSNPGSAEPSSFVAKPLDAKTALARFGSPFATSPDWSPSPYDARLTHLPQLDFDLRIKMRFSGPSSEQRALAPPPSFSRHFQPYHPFPSQFEPIYIRSANNKKAQKQLLSDGFQPVYPGRLMVQHDVSAADWGRFLEDLVVAGRLTGKQSIISNVAPIAMHLGATGYFVTKTIEKGMKKRNDPLICEVVETFQQNFFSVRNLDVYIVHNGERLTARSPNATIPAGNFPVANRRSETGSSTNSSSSSSSSESEDDDAEARLQTINGQKLDESGRKMLRSQRKAERKQRRAEKKHERELNKIERKHKRAEKKHERELNKIEKKHKRAQRKYADMPDLPPLPQRGAGSSSSSIQSMNVPGHTGGWGGYHLIIAPLSPVVNVPAGDAAASMW